ncbi:DUF3562 domain-containing protein [Caballeronia mineralivorans]|uniref:DUF3562 domain-containing protein n=1 Tax=Caballeronia mineralivorans TaxID=2010198 RepID=UPI00094F567E|nr:DUF3562 domain-containing protein [Caballeronia mineralivorans]
MNRSTDERLVEQIAQETHTSVQAVSKTYEDTMASYRDGARIHDYMSLLAAKSVRANLKPAKAWFRRA